MKRISILMTLALCLALVATTAMAQARNPKDGSLVEPYESPLLNFAPVPSGGGSPFCSTPNLAIPDNVPAGVTDSQVIGNSFTINDLNVSLMVAHTWIGDLIFNLSHTGGSSVTFYDRPGVPASTFGCSSNDIDATYDDEGTDGTAEDTCLVGPPGHAGSLTPNNPLSAFDGENISGDWTLTASDNAGGDTGTLVMWCIETDPVPVELMEFSID